MNLIVIGLHVFFGGLRARVRVCIVINFVSQFFILLIAVLYIARYGAMIVLHPIYFVISAINFLFAIVQSYMLRKMIRKESKYMLPMNLLMFHKSEYLKEFMEKLKKGPNYVA
jgi:hypothetical protein